MAYDKIETMLNDIVQEIDECYGINGLDSIEETKEAIRETLSKISVKYKEKSDSLGVLYGYREGYGYDFLERGKSDELEKNINDYPYKHFKIVEKNKERVISILYWWIKFKSDITQYM